LLRVRVRVGIRISVNGSVIRADDRVKLRVETQSLKKKALAALLAPGI
jgi:flagellar biosynthesis regulator FlbT